MRSVSATFLAAQQAASNTPYCKLVFTSKGGGTTVDLSTDSSAYGNRILLIDHTEEPYDDFATIILRNHDRTIPRIKGYWTEIGYGYVTGSNEYLGDSTNEGAPPRLWVKHQQTISAGGKLWELLELEGMWAKLRETLIRLGNPPLYTKSYTTDTIYTIIGLVLAECVGSGVAMSLNTLVEDDGIINSLQPQFDINAQPFEYAAPLIYRLLHMTASYLKALDDLEFEIKYPNASDEVDITYHSDQAPYFYEYLERINTLMPNHFVVYGNEGTDGLWSNYKVSASPYGIDQGEIDEYDEIYKIILSGSLTTQAQVNSRAAALMARAKFEQLAGRMFAPHDARLELFDRIRAEDSRGIAAEVIGVIADAVSDTDEFDTVDGASPTIIRTGNVFAVIYTSTSAVGTIKTYAIAADGTIGTMIDSDTFATIASYPEAIHVSGNIYAIVFQGADQDGYIVTRSITPEGIIGSANVDFLEFDGDAAWEPIIIHISGKIYAIVYRDADTDGWLRTITIDPDGDNIAEVDNYEFDGTTGYYPVIIHVSGTTYAIAYTDNDGDGQILTLTIADNGTITKTPLATLEFDEDTASKIQIAHLRDTLYVLVYTAAGSDGWIRTVTITSAGAIANVDSYEFTSGTADVPKVVVVGRYGSNTVIAVTFNDADNSGWVATFSIADTGEITESTVDSLEFESGTADPIEVIHVGGDIYAVVYTGSGNDGFMKTFEIASSAFYPTDGVARTSSVRHIYRPGMFRMQVGVGDIGLDIDIAETAVRKELETAEDWTAVLLKGLQAGALSREEKQALMRQADPKLWKAAEALTQKIPLYEPPPEPKPEPTLWQKLTPWKEEEGETFGSEAMERLKQYPFRGLVEFIQEKLSGRDKK